MEDEGLGAEILDPKFSMADHPQNQSDRQPSGKCLLQETTNKGQTKLSMVSFNRKSFSPNIHTHTRMFKHHIPYGYKISNSFNILSLIALQI